MGSFVQNKVKEGQVLAEQLVCPCVEPERCAVPLFPKDVKLCLAGSAEGERQPGQLRLFGPAWCTKTKN